MQIFNVIDNLPLPWLPLDQVIYREKKEGSTVYFSNINSVLGKYFILMEQFTLLSYLLIYVCLYILPFLDKCRGQSLSV